MDLRKKQRLSPEVNTALVVYLEEQRSTISILLHLKRNLFITFILKIMIIPIDYMFVQSNIHCTHFMPGAGETVMNGIASLFMATSH